jgi:Excalibur calcium-binding domain
MPWNRATALGPDTSRLPRRHLRIAGLANASTVVVPFRKRKWRTQRLRQHRGTLLLIAAAAIGGFVYVGAQLVGDPTSAKPAFYASLPIPNCATARALGLAPAYRGDPGYRSHLDRDNDGIACEPYRPKW